MRSTFSSLATNKPVIETKKDTNTNNFHKNQRTGIYFLNNNIIKVNESIYVLEEYFQLNKSSLATEETRQFTKKLCEAIVLTS